ncbi:MAG: hypothetical protein PVG03_07370 [Desulfarculaceae bacterium]|jgi:hypothetical protein
MARIAALGLSLLMMTLVSAGCGVKSPPLPSTKIAPAKVSSLTAKALPDGVEVSFDVPQEDKPDRQVEQAILFYGYFPIEGDPACPPCPPQLTKYHRFEVNGREDKRMQGGRFVYRDSQAPRGKEAVYQVVLIDSRGRKSEPSPLAKAYRVEPPPPPAGLTVEADEGKVTLTWEGNEVPAQSEEIDAFAGWVVFRRGPEGEKQLNARPLRQPTLVDQTVENGKVYAYRVAGVRRIKLITVNGEATPWLEAKPRDMTPPQPPTDLMGAGAAQGLLLRFTPSPDQDVAGYQVLRKFKDSGDWEQINKGLVPENTFTDKQVEPGKTYLYKVKAVDESGNQSPESKVLEIKHLP